MVTTCMAFLLLLAEASSLLFGTFRSEEAMQVICQSIKSVRRNERLVLTQSVFDVMEGQRILDLTAAFAVFCCPKHGPEYMHIFLCTRHDDCIMLEKCFWAKGTACNIYELDCLKEWCAQTFSGHPLVAGGYLSALEHYGLAEEEENEEEDGDSLLS